MAHGVIRTDGMSGTTLGKDLVTLKSNSDLDNGSVVVVGALYEGEREARQISTPTASSALKDIAIIASPEVDKSKSYNNLNEFYNKAGSEMRGYRLVSHDTFSLTADAYEGTAAVGSIVELQAKTKLKVVASATQGSTTVGKIIAIEDEYAVIEVD